MYLRTTEKFWSKVDKQGPNGCWVWTGKTIRGGYGDFAQSVNGKWKHIIAHRWAWAEAHGEVPAGILVLHHCDNPPCVNPEHLFLGTQQDNVLDMHSKRRGNPPRGEEQPTSKLTVQDVEEIRRLINVEHASRSAVGRQFGLHHETVRKIALGRLWSHVPMAHPPWTGRISLKGLKHPRKAKQVPPP
jgi:hypothetical protein